MIVDLEQFKSESLEVKMLDGKTIHLPKPAYRLFLKLAEFETNEHKGVEAINDIYDVALECVNSNTDGIAYDAETIKAYPIEIASALVREYEKFATGVTSRKNS